jgi:hypothetical protein
MCTPREIKHSQVALLIIQFRIALCFQKEILAIGKSFDYFATVVRV